MAYRNGTYVAFDGGGDTDIKSGDIKYFNLLKAWNKSANVEFSFSDSHQKTYQVSDGSKISTLRARLLERIKSSKNFLLILSEDTKEKNQNLNWEIDKANEYDLPFIIVYPGYKKVLRPSSHRDVWTTKLTTMIDEENVKCVHVPFKKEPIFDAIGQFSVVANKYPKSPLSYYGDETYKSWGIE